jgi:peptide/nickel transport system substrate-binding protein
VNRWRSTWSLAFAVAIVAASCGSSTDTSSPAASTAASAAATASAAPADTASAPASAEASAQASASTAPVPSPTDQPLRVGWLSEPDTMNPLTTYSTEAVEVTQLMYDKLLDYDLQLRTEPSLAKDFAYSADGKSITFHLRDGVTWQDGQPLTSADVAYTFNLVHDNSLGQYAQFLVDLTTVKTPDAATIELDFKSPQAYNPGLIVPIVPKHIWSKMSAKEIEKFANDKPVGSGPFAFGEWKKGASLTLARNDKWWGQLPSEATITWVRYGNSDVMGQALRSGEIDIIPQVPPTVFDGLQGADAVKAVSLPSYSFHHIGFNVSDNPKSGGNPLLKDLVVRQALEKAVDRNQLVQLCLAGHGQQGDSIVPVGLTDWHLAIPADKVLNNDPDGAKAMLDAAGYKDDGSGVRKSADGKELSFRLIAIATTDVDVCAAKLFVDAAAAVGIKLDFQTLDETTLGDTVYNSDAPNWDIFVWGWDSGTPDPSYMLGVPLCSQFGNNNDVYYCNKEYDAEYSQQATTVDVAARKAITDKMQQTFYDSAAYLVMWYQDKLQAYRTDTWSNWGEIPGGIVFNFTRDNYLNIVPAAH